MNPDSEVDGDIGITYGYWDKAEMYYIDNNYN